MTTVEDCLFPERLSPADEIEAAHQSRLLSARWFSPLFVDEDMCDEVREELAERLPRWEAHRHTEHAVANRIESAARELGRGFDVQRLVRKLRTCRMRGIVSLYGDACRVLWDEKCDLGKLCPDSSNAERKRLVHRDVPVLTEWLSRSRRRRLFYAVFTERNFWPGTLLEGKRWMMERFNAWRKNFPQVRGATVVQEDPLSAAGEWNVHNNVLMLVEGEFSYEKARAEWGANVEFQHIAGDAESLARTYAELVKYSAQVVATKSAEKRARHATDAPAMLDWPAARLMEWLQANGLTTFSRRFKRTRHYGALHCPEATIWAERPVIELVMLCEAAGVDTRAPAWPWRRLDAIVGPGTRARLLAHLRPSQASYRESEALHLGSIVWDGTRYGVDLIPGDNSRGEMSFSPASPDHWPTGPPIH